MIGALLGLAILATGGIFGYREWQRRQGASAPAAAPGSSSTAATTDPWIGSSDDPLAFGHDEPTPTPPLDLDLSGALSSGGLRSNPGAFAAKRPTPSPTATGFERHRSPKFGFWFDAPDGFLVQEGDDTTTTAVGTMAGQPALIIAKVQPADGAEVTKELLDVFASSITSSGQAREVRRGVRRVRGAELITVTADMTASGMRLEFVLYARPTFLVVMAMGTMASAFDATAAFRDEFFTQHVGFE